MVVSQHLAFQSVITYVILSQCVFMSTLGLKCALYLLLHYLKILMILE